MRTGRCVWVSVSPLAILAAAAPPESLPRLHPEKHPTRGREMLRQQTNGLRDCVDVAPAARERVVVLNRCGAAGPEHQVHHLVRILSRVRRGQTAPDALLDRDRPTIRHGVPDL